MHKRLLCSIIAVLWLNAPGEAAGPARIVSLSPSLTREICELGEQRRLVGVATHEKLKLKAAVVGNLKDINIEAILALRPDLVVASKDANERRDIETLRSLGLSVEVFEGCESLTCMQSEFLRLAGLLGRRDQAVAINARVTQALGAPGLKHRPRVLWLVSVEPLITVNDATFTAEFIRRAGGVNIFGNLNTRYPCVNVEEIIARRPEVIIVVAGMGNRLNLSGLENLPAVKNGRVYYLAADTICQPTPLQFLKGYGLVRGVLAKAQPRSDSRARSRAR